MIKLGIIGHPLPITSHFPLTSSLNNIQWTGYFSDGANGSPVTPPALREYGSAEHLIEVSDALIFSGSKSDTFNLAVNALKQARHAFFPVTLLQTVTEANRLIKLANEANVFLKVFRPGSYSPDLLKDQTDKGNVWLLELRHFVRSGTGAAGRNLFYNLLYNLDFVLSLTRSNVVNFKASGLSLRSDKADILSARVDFDNGCSASLNCNIAAVNDEHSCTIVLKEKTIRVDFHRQEATVWNLNHPEPQEEPLPFQRLNFQQRDSLAENLSSFVASLQDIDHSLANPEDGFRSFILATRIMDRVNKAINHPA